MVKVAWNNSTVLITNPTERVPGRGPKTDRQTEQPPVGHTSNTKRNGGTIAKRSSQRLGRFIRSGMFLVGVARAERARNQRMCDHQSHLYAANGDHRGYPNGDGGGGWPTTEVGALNYMPPALQRTRASVDIRRPGDQVIGGTRP